MREFKTEKLSMSLLPSATVFFPVEGRKYTMTHSDSTGDMFVSIGCYYDADKINPILRDEVFAEWSLHIGQYVLRANVLVSGGEFDENLSAVRFLIFEKEMPTALKAIVTADRSFYAYFPWLLDMPIYVEFDSIFPQYHQIKYFGTVRQYLINDGT
ncbi:staygreen family protein [Falsibacillus albus]|uniref:Staygreen protein domain-containing protein n=1 Tax=Falsibacillus albus TaxID=2478915 RepID=A0A3L7JZA9_9BACI|nr:staygreen family protein [Falsibacillus albus]RLQ96147.1 hypothetical protein D9X91_07605 [Falsibacillus albus]